MKNLSQNKVKKNKGKIRENIETMFSAILIALLIRVFLIEPYKIPTGSMIPTLIVGDQLLVNKFIYGVRIPILGWKLPAIMSPSRGDIVVFHYPKYSSPGIHWEFLDLISFGVFGLTNTPNDPKNFIKRAIGIPGDVISFQNQIFKIKTEQNNVFKEIPIHYETSISKKKYKNILSKLNEIRLPGINSYFPLFIRTKDFEQVVSKKITSKRDLQLIKHLYQRDEFDKGYKLILHGNEDLLKKANSIFKSINFPKPFYRKRASGSYMGYNGQSLLKLEILNANTTDYLAHLIQIESSMDSINHPFLYVPKKDDLIEINFISNSKNTSEGKILFKVNKHLLVKLGIEEYNLIYNNYYKSIFNNVLEQPGRKLNYIVKDNYYFMIGDNRDVSSDSREWGLVHENNIIGSPIMIYWPYSRFGRIAY